MKIYQSKTKYYKIVKAVFDARTEYIVEQKSKGKSTWGDFTLFPSLFRLLNKNPYEWRSVDTKESFEEAERKIDWHIDIDNEKHNETFPHKVEAL